ncbi:MAG: ankyrin repeat domain-containing protein [Bryobacterales bacterium]
MRLRCLPGLWLVAVFSVGGLDAAGARDAALNNSPLADAVERHDTAAVASLLKEQADVNAPQPDGATALHWAAYLGDAETTELLIRAGARVNAPNHYGVTPLVLASQNGSAEVLEKLLNAGADLNSAVRSDESPLMLAARTGRVDAVKVLLNAGADINAREAWNGQTALMWAAAAGHGPVVETLIAAGADIRARSNGGTSPLLFAVRKGDMRSVQALLAAGADVNEKRPDLATPLLVAIINGREELVDFLLDKGADPNVEGGTTELTVHGVRAKPIEIELETPPHRKQLLQVATEGGNGKNNSWGRPLQAAVHVANWHISDQFISVDIDRLRVIKALLSHGADVNGRNTDMEPRWSGARYRRRLVGATAFLFAAKSADVEVMRLLLEHGADPTISTGLNITPLMAAAGIAWASNQDRASEAEVLDAVKLLVEEVGADVNAVNDVGETAMHAAAYRGANSVVQYLYDKGAKLDMVALDGRTPLIIADGVEYGNSFAAQPHTAALLRKLGAQEMECPGQCVAEIPEEALPQETLR